MHDEYLEKINKRAQPIALAEDAAAARRQSGFVACSAVAVRWLMRYPTDHDGKTPTPAQVVEFLLSAAELYNGGVLVVGGVEAEKLTRACSVRAEAAK